MTGPERIAAAFAGGTAFMPYMMGGFPDLDRSRAIADAYADGGADLVELGIPFSDPLADGPVIQAAGAAALRAATTVDGVLGVCAHLSPRVPVVLMVYANVVLAGGAERFVAAARAHGADGLIVPDLPAHEAGDVRAACDAAGLALVPLVAPTTTDARLREIGANARGFLYAVSVTGTTGERAAVDVATIVGRARAATDVPVAIGFGIGTPEQAVDAARDGADGVIVGSRLVRAAAEGEDVEALVRSFTDALRADGLVSSGRPDTPVE